ncbi:hypothetical protein K491DRAFT_778577 [Lophiostoma macrostomum CBS 122681]|uniref:Uncharacterized protein n=1 Tax=Lophiostoma macrostomum CBS 122681 TaxID=1314788 RepID=A0A6A6T7I8_9PLEO|nr:hypothetical protein K491DRAFT_778577 [Lophiostoma macrostomum CBS 122681]
MPIIEDAESNGMDLSDATTDEDEDDGLVEDSHYRFRMRMWLGAIVAVRGAGGIYRGSRQRSYPAVASSTPFILFRSPRELRDAVCKEAFASLDLPTTIMLRIDSYTLSSTACPSELEILMFHEFPDIIPPFCYINRQTYAESVPIFLRSPRKVVLGGDSGLHLFASFLSRVPGRNAFSAVTHLSLENKVPWRYLVEKSWRSAGKRKWPLHYPGNPKCSSDTWTANDLLENCPNLQHVAIEYNCSSFIDLRKYIYALTKEGSSDPVEPELLPQEEIMEKLGPFSLFKLTRLKSVKITCLTGDLINYTTRMPRQQVFAYLVDWIQEEKGNQGATWDLDVQYEDRHEHGIDRSDWDKE